MLLLKSFSFTMLNGDQVFLFILNSKEDNVFSFLLTGKCDRYVSNESGVTLCRFDVKI